MPDYIDMYADSDRARAYFAQVERSIERMLPDKPDDERPADGIQNGGQASGKPLAEEVHNLYVKRYLDSWGYREGRREVLARLAFDSYEPEDDSWKGDLRDSEAVSRSVRLSLLTPVMAELDDALVETQLPEAVEKANLYKPYYYEFDAVIDPGDTDSLNAIDDLKSNLAFEGPLSNWFPAKLTEIEGDQSPATDPETADADVPPLDADDKPRRFLDGTLTFIGSLPTLYKARLSWEAKLTLDPALTPKPIPTFKTIAQLSDIQSALSDVLGDDSTGYRAYVLDVGQASCSYLIGKGGNVYRGGIFVDLGLPTIGNQPASKRDQNALDKNMTRIIGWKPRAALISHWHEDHVKAAFILDPANTFLRKNMRWIAPVENINSQSIKRLILYLERHCRVCWIDHTFDGKIAWSDSGQSTMGKGRGTRKVTVKDPNANGLVFRIRSAVFAGDCMYRNWPEGMGGTAGKISNLVVPHHGAPMKPADETALGKH